MLESFNREYVWTANMLKGIDDSFAASGLSVETYTFYMDLKRIKPTAEYFALVRDLIERGYGRLDFDVLLACDNDALDFLRRYRDELFPGVPLVFSSINDYDASMLDGRSDLTGTSENTDYRGTLDLALKLWPRARRVFIVVDETTTGRAHRSAMEKLRPDFEARAPFEYLSFSDYTLEGLAERLRGLPRDSIVLLLQHFMDRNGVSHSVQESTPILSAASSVPVFILADIRLGLGPVGGHVVSGYYHGAAAADMALRIMSGTPVAQVPVLLESPNKYMVDWKALSRFGIRESALPEGSVVIGRPQSFFERYWIYVVTLAFVFAAMLVVMLFLQREVRKRTRLAVELKAAGDRVQAILDTAMDGFFLSDMSGRILSVNHSYCRMSGYSEREILGMSLSDLDALMSPEAIREKIAAVVAAGEGRFESRHRRKDGSLFDIEVSVQYRADDGGLFVSFLRDITDRKRAEQELSRNLAEKEVLLREVHHRVKNNLNVISSLLDLQAIAVGEASQARSALEASRGRVMAMALVQEELYKSGDYTSVEMGPYLRKLATQLEVAMGARGQVSFALEAEPLALDVGNAIPVGLIVNELVTNAYKHAFPDGRGSILVSLSLDGGTGIVAVADDGRGLPPGWDADGRGSLGVTLVRLLATQLDGRVESAPGADGRGTRFELRFPIGSPSPAAGGLG